MPRKTARYPEGPLHYLREWREYRNNPEGTMTQEKLGALVVPPTTGSVIHLLEVGARPAQAEREGVEYRKVSDQWAHRLAKALRITPGWLFDINPDEQTRADLEMWQSIHVDDKPAIMDLAETMQRRRAREGKKG